MPQTLFGTLMDDRQAQPVAASQGPNTRMPATVPFSALNGNLVWLLQSWEQSRRFQSLEDALCFSMFLLPI